MTKCKSGRTIIRTNTNNKSTYYIRLNFIETDATGSRKYYTRDINTGLKATKRNKIKADAMIEAEIAKHNSGNQNTPFSVYCSKWLEKRKAELETITYEGYQYRINHIISYFEEHPITLGNITAETVDDFYHTLLVKEKAATSQHAEKGLSNRTIKDIATLLRAILNDALLLGHVGNRESVLAAIA